MEAAVGAGQLGCRQRARLAEELADDSRGRTPGPQVGRRRPAQGIGMQVDQPGLLAPAPDGGPRPLAGQRAALEVEEQGCGRRPVRPDLVAAAGSEPAAESPGDGLAHRYQPAGVPADPQRPVGQVVDGEIDDLADAQARVVEQLEQDPVAPVVGIPSVDAVEEPGDHRLGEDRAGLGRRGAPTGVI